MENINTITLNTERSTTIKFQQLIPQSLPTYDISEDKELEKYIKNVERILRSSFEYRKYIYFLRNELDLNKCVFFKGIDLSTVKKVSLEFHHHPFTLYDIVEIVIRKKLSEGNVYEDMFTSPIEIADEVCEMHFKNEIGLIPLTTTIHQLAHDGEVFIPVNLVFGNVKKFVNNYKEFMTDIMLEKLKIYKDVSRCHRNLTVLEKNFKYIDINDRKKLQLVELLKTGNKIAA